MNFKCRICLYDELIKKEQLLKSSRAVIHLMLLITCFIYMRQDRVSWIALSLNHSHYINSNKVSSCYNSTNDSYQEASNHIGYFRLWNIILSSTKTLENRNQATVLPDDMLNFSHARSWTPHAWKSKQTPRTRWTWPHLDNCLQAKRSLSINYKNLLFSLIYLIL